MKTLEKINWKQELKDYRDMLQWDCHGTTDYKNMSQADAKEALQNDLEFIIGTNGVNELFESELRIAKILNLDLEQM